MPFLTLPTHRLHYRIDGAEGDKPWLTFCNSLGTDLQMWDAQIADLSQEFRVLRYDRRGHSGSGTPPPPYSLSDLGSDVVALWDALSIERSHFCGLSIGGLTGQWLGIHAPSRLDRLILCATAARIGTVESWTTRRTEVEAQGLQPLVPATAERWFTPTFRQTHPEAVDAILKAFVTTSVEGYAGCCAALAGADLRPSLSRISAPVLAISGDDDPVCPPADLEAIAKGVQNGRHVSLPGRHIVNLEAAPQFNATLSKFLIQG
ncbi:3-oxoadipate enol-lactonase [Paracoccus sulfuroxidans]|uniref:3-oxoadipate enol-lactonase n=1 Tax=Paracoccus sulfuroxidans TaxID=384678 RepID=A0A562NAU4_9RHOB|nr:3-oxoadipate enol-lactonase [Paracoccus sulfuroxidans]TWI29285.1 3-oxoadipate enol-lactonase [Paracoccus sulfuroxidans]